MKVINVVMTDKEFEIYWKTINKYMEEMESKSTALMKLTGNTPESFFKGMFGLPESFFRTILMGAKYIGRSDEDLTSTLRFIKAVLNG